ncbi:MAG TPA: geranylgeranyl reductase family protein [Gaiellaceae bacterium]|nr:geranylgeranyl reductase family protein [Gaiellaceae bacterium]
MPRFDAIVVGAGPAGSTCAYRLASAGASVLLLDRARFPRDKPCGGGVTGRAARLLPFSLAPVVEDTVTSVRMRLRYGSWFERGEGAPLVFMTQRLRLDAYLAEQAAAAGAELRDGVKVTAVSSEADGVSVTANGETIRADALVGADGVNGISARQLELGGNQEVGVALEANVLWEKLGDGYRGRAVLELGVVPGGYGWVFPKGDHANVGIGGWGREAPGLRGHLRALCAAHGIEPQDLEDVRGYRLPLRSPRSTLARGRAAVVGDAAGLVDPVSGDGMFEAFLSAKLAAGAVLDVLAGRADGLEPYGEGLTRQLGTHLWASWGVKGALDRFPRTTFRIARSRIVWRTVEKLVRGEIDDVGAARGLARPPLKALAALARASGDPGGAYRQA